VQYLPRATTLHFNRLGTLNKNSIAEFRIDALRLRALQTLDEFNVDERSAPKNGNERAVQLKKMSCMPVRYAQVAYTRYFVYFRLAVRAAVRSSQSSPEVAALESRATK
jgi:hypothetical protein